MAGGPDQPPSICAIATMIFADQSAMDTALGGAGPGLADIPYFTDTKPQMPPGEIVA
ncbi:hypothetical protein ACFMPD_06020 [Sedimentitalea sp. HM32M-2]|uniref:hypothetical protein n=1 Tax=Sedimentitalea sp. HM32M-2 TaxID=3351566 RepID=UPI0036458C8A